MKPRFSYETGTPPQKEVVGSCSLFLFLGFDLKDRASVVVAAFRADPVGGVRNAIFRPQRTVGVQGGLHRTHDVVRAALTGTAVGMTSFWVRHFSP